MFKNLFSDESKFKEFLKELEEIASVAEAEVTHIKDNKGDSKESFEKFTKITYKIKSASVQFELKNIAKLASLAEEISIKAQTETSRSKRRKCADALWDAATTIKYLVHRHSDTTTEEQDILINRLEFVLNSLGGERPKITEDEIEKLFS